VARTYRVSGMGRLGSPFGRKAAVGFGSRANLQAIDERLRDIRGLGATFGDIGQTSALPTSYSASGEPLYTVDYSNTPPPPQPAPYVPGQSSTPAAPASSSTPGWTPAQEAQVLTAAINTGGVLGKQAIIGSPTVSYNPATGQYTATGGATLPSGIALGSTISSLFSNPLVLLAIAGIVAVSVMK
jgi:hypothetical protein